MFTNVIWKYLYDLVNKKRATRYFQRRAKKETLFASYQQRFFLSLLY
ncbi:hypothetical protein [Halobacillus dabanensis]|nr:hypothetical protein [Halobacillus dabanensis]